MKFWEIFRFELYYQFRRPVVWVCCLLILAIPILLLSSMTQSVTDGQYFLNSPIIVALTVSVGSLIGLLLAAASSGNAAARDGQNNIAPLFKTLALNKFTYLGGRFLALLAIPSLVLMVGSVALVIASQIPMIENYFTSNNLNAYFLAFFIFGLPNSFIFTGIIFAVCVFFRKGAVAFLVALLLFFMAQFAMEFVAAEFGDWKAGKRYDLTGMTILRELRILYASNELKDAHVPITAELIINRISWMGLSALFLLVAYTRFSFKNLTGRKNSKKIKPLSTEIVKSWQASVNAPSVLRTFETSTVQSQFLELTKSWYIAILRIPAWLILVLVGIILGIWSGEILEGPLGVSMIASSYKIIELFSLPPVKIIIMVLLTFYTGEIIWKERDAGISSLLNASPIANWVLSLSKFGSLLLLLISIQTFFLMASVAIQLLNGNTDIELVLMFQVFFGFQFIDWLLFLLLAFAIHVLINQKFLGHILVILAFVLVTFPNLFNLDHKLLIYGAAPTWSYSEMRGFGPNLIPWLWFKFYWLLWGIVLLFVARFFWDRGEIENFKSRLLNSLKSFKPSAQSIAFATLICLVGGFIFYNTNILNTYTSPDEKMAIKAEYEKKYSAFRNSTQPTIKRIFINGEIFPDGEEMEVKGKYLLINNSSETIDSLHISTTANRDELKFLSTNQLSELLVDDNLGHRIFRFQPGFKPGDSIQIEFIQEFENDGFSNNGKSSTIVKNGTYFGFENLPWIGYNSYRELNDSLSRAKFNLNPKPTVTSIYDEKARRFVKNQIEFEAVLGTSYAQTAITAGKLERSWEENGRNYFHYKTEVPITHNFEILSAEYEVLRGKSEDVAIEIYHHPNHTANLDRYMKGIQEAVRFFSEQFGRYPHKVIRMVEFPSGATFLNGNPVTMSYSEGFANFSPQKDPRNFDFPFAIMAHEVAHQWWGDRLSPAPIEGAGLLTESLAWFSSWILIEEFYGKKHLENLLEVMRREYITPRPLAGNPLIRSTDQFSVYRRGPFALYALREHIGGEKMMDALRNLIEKFEAKDSQLPISLDLYNELNNVTSDSLKPLLEDLLKRNTYWEFGIEDPSLEKTESGHYKVKFNLKTNKFSVNEKGVKTAGKLNNSIEIELFNNTSDFNFGKSIYFQKHKIDSSEKTIEILLDKRPDAMMVDPRGLFMDLNSADNYFVFDNLK